MFRDGTKTSLWSGLRNRSLHRKTHTERGAGPAAAMWRKSWYSCCALCLALWCASSAAAILPDGAARERLSLPEDVDEVILPIEARWHRRGESGPLVERSQGTGFVIGRHYFSVHHTIAPSTQGWSPAQAVIEQTELLIAGVAVGDPIYLNKTEDIVVFALPEELCQRYCNDLRLQTTPPPEPGENMVWLRHFRDDYQWKSARVVRSIHKRWRPEVQGCDGNLVVQVDIPFVSGSSGSPVMNAETGAIVGIIQGSFRSRIETVGFFKPIHCVQQQVQAAGVALAASQPAPAPPHVDSQSAGLSRVASYSGQ